MALIFSSIHSDTHLNRKALKRPDGMTVVVSRFFESMSRNVTPIAAIVFFLFIVGLLAAFWINHKNERAQVARNALYVAEKAIQEKMKELAAASDEPETAKSGIVSKSKQKSKTEEIIFKKIDVDVVFADATNKLKTVEKDFGGTKAAFEARMVLGSLYFNHGDPEKAAVWFQKAIDTAPRSTEKALAASSLGYSNENLNKFNEAIATYQNALNLGETTIKGDLLLAIGRCYEALHDSAKARSIYDQVLVELPNSIYSKSAEVLKNQLH